MKHLFPARLLFSALLINASAQDQASSSPNTVTVSGIIYQDSNGNRIADGKDKMAEGAKVSLMVYPAEDGKELNNSTTNDAGQYSFENVAAGTYQLLITYPTGLTVLTRPFVVKPADGDLYLAFPLVDRVSAARFTNLRIVNPGQKLFSIDFKKTKDAEPPAASISPFAPK